MRLETSNTVRRSLGLTPLIDVVFLLLLFFMLASTFQKYGEIDLATAGTGAGAVPADRPLLVRLHKDGSIDVNAQAVLIDGLAEALADAVADDEKRVLVQVREGAPTQGLVDVLERVRALGIKRVMVAR